MSITVLSIYIEELRQVPMSWGLLFFHGLVLVAIDVAMMIYLVPTLVAAHRKHLNTMAIFVLNLLLGWTFLGWAVAMVWAFTQAPTLTKPCQPYHLVWAVTLLGYFLFHLNLVGLNTSSWWFWGLTAGAVLTFAMIVEFFRSGKIGKDTLLPS
jgi:hypothetical protein